MPKKKTNIADEINQHATKKLSRETTALIVIGVLLLLFYLLYQLHQGSILSFEGIPQKTLSSPDDSLSPISVQFLPSQYSVTVRSSQIANGKWQIADQGASFLSSSAKPGTKGSIIIYAHNTKNRFGILQSVKLGETISVVTKNGSLHSYIVREKLTVKPSQTDVLESKNTETLVLYTCTGFADTKRLVVKALPL